MRMSPDYGLVIRGLLRHGNIWAATWALTHLIFGFTAAPQAEVLSHGFKEVKL